MREYTWNIQRNAGDLRILDGSPIPSKLLKADAETIREWIDNWLLANGLEGVMGLPFEDRRRGAFGTVGYLDGEEWIAALGFMGMRMILPNDQNSHL